MSGKRQPTDVVKANGKKHLSLAEEDARREMEVRTDTPKYVRPPVWLEKDLVRDFKKLANQLIKLNIFSALDKDTLGRYLTAQRHWEQTSARITEALDSGDLEAAEKWGKMQDRFFKQARGCASDLGLTITSRCRLVVPQTDDGDDFDDGFGALLGGLGADSRG